MTAFRVFSGWDHRQAEAAEVFAYSVRANASVEVDVRFLYPDGGRIWAMKPQSTPAGVQNVAFARQGVTQFTYSRFLVPYLCGFEGRAVFVDGCDMLCLGDVRELAELPMEHPIYVAKHPPLPGLPRMRPRSWTSMMLLDCAAFRDLWTPERVASAHDQELMRLGDFDDSEIGELPPGWNMMIEPDGEAEPPPGAKLVHWSYLADPNGNSWIDRSGSKVWAEWRAHWLASLAPAEAEQP